MLLRLASTLPRFQAPTIRYESPAWHAHIPGRRAPAITVHASTRIEAKFRAADELGCAVQIVVVELVPDLKLLRFNRVA